MIAINVKEFAEWVGDKKADHPSPNLWGVPSGVQGGVVFYNTDQLIELFHKEKKDGYTNLYTVRR